MTQRDSLVELQKPTQRSIHTRVSWWGGLAQKPLQSMSESKEGDTGITAKSPLSSHTAMLHIPFDKIETSSRDKVQLVGLSIVLRKSYA